MNKLTTLQLLNFILESIELLRKRVVGMQVSDDFFKDDDSIIKLEANFMRLQATGEAIKNLDKREKEFLYQVADREYWSDIIRFRDLISHHYTDLQADDVFEICTNELDELEEKILKLKELL